MFYLRVSDMFGDEILQAARERDSASELVVVMAKAVTYYQSKSEYVTMEMLDREKRLIIKIDSNYEWL